MYFLLRLIVLYIERQENFNTSWAIELSLQSEEEHHRILMVLGRGFNSAAHYCSL
jgi:hypothetical protein